MYDPVSAIVGGSVIGAGASIYGASKAAKATKQAADTSADASRYMYDRTVELNDPFYQQGLSALEDIDDYDSSRLPTYEDTVSKPMDDWNYEQSDSYKAQYGLGMEELNKQLQARSLAPSGVGATRAADLSRKLTATDYDKERTYRKSSLSDLYNSRLSENQNRYQQLLDKVKMGTGATSAMGAAGNQYASQVGQSATAKGEAEAGFYSGLGGVPTSTMATGLKMYDMGNKGGWWE